MNKLALRTSTAFAGLLLVAAVPLGAAMAQTPPASTAQPATPASPPAPPAQPTPPAAGQTPPPTATPPAKTAEPGDQNETRRGRAEERRDRAERRRAREEERRQAHAWRRAMGPFAFSFLCGARTAEAVDFYLEGITRIVEPTAAQRGQYDELKQAAAKAREEAQTGCNGDVPMTPTGRLEAIQARLDAVLRAVRTLRPALDAFYDSLSNEQKARFNAMTSEPRRRGHWRDRWLRH